MTITSRVPSALGRRQMILDCRDMDFDVPSSEGVADSVIAWVMSFPQRSAMHVYLPCSVPSVRRLQCTLQSLGCVVSRVTKCLPSRL